MLQTCGLEFFRVERCLAGQQFIEQHAQAVDVCARVDVQTAHLRLLRAHVGRRANELLEAGEHCLIRELNVGGRFGDAEIDHLGDRHAIMQCHQDVGGLDVTVNDPFLMGVLHGMADLDEQLQTFDGGQLVLVTVLSEFDSPHQLHHKKGPARLSRPGIEHFGDVGMVHQRQGLALRFEPGDDLASVHAELDDLERDSSFYWLFLLRHVHHAPTALADFLEDFVAADHFTLLLRRGWLDLDGFGSCGRGHRRGLFVGTLASFFQKRAGLVMDLEQLLNPLAQARFARAGHGQIGRALLRRQLQRAIEDGDLALWPATHGVLRDHEFR